MAEIRLIDGNELLKKNMNFSVKTTVRHSMSEKEKHEKVLQSVIDYIKSEIQSSATIDPETLPIVRELREKLERATAERDEAVKDRAELSDFYLTTCEQFCFGNRKRDIAPCEWNWFGRCKLREWCGPQKDAGLLRRR